VDSDPHKILDERAIETQRRAGQFHSSSAPQTSGSDHGRVKMMIVAGSRQRTNKTKTVACAICRKSFTQRRSTARFCSPKCRQRAHRRAGLSQVDELRSAKGCSKRNVRPTRGPSGSGVGVSTLHPPQQPEPVSDSVARSSAPRIVADQHWPNMWRIVFPDGRLSDMLNITRAKEALKHAQRSSRRAYR
jgi:hypothetical protein